jgi:GntR family transcriptional regulator
VNINFDAAKPIYNQIIEEIKKMIVRGELEPGEKLPSQRSMAQKVEVNPNTIQRAYREMENMNLVETKRGLGTFIREDSEVINNVAREMANKSVEQFVKQMKSLGFDEKSILEIVNQELSVSSSSVSDRRD